jgi:hypothetical protein
METIMRVKRDSLGDFMFPPTGKIPVSMIISAKNDKGFAYRQAKCS